MAFLILILIGFGFYLVLKSQGLEIRIQKLETHIRDLEDQLRRIHTKIVNQLPGFLDEGKGKMPAPKAAPTAASPAAAAPAEAVSTSKPIINCPRCWAPMEVTAESCDQCGNTLKAPVMPPPQTPKPVEQAKPVTPFPSPSPLPQGGEGKTKKRRL